MISTFEFTYHERVDNAWSAEIEADNEEEARTILLARIQGTEPNESQVVASYWD